MSTFHDALVGLISETKKLHKTLNSSGQSLRGAHKKFLKEALGGAIRELYSLHHIVVGKRLGGKPAEPSPEVFDEAAKRPIPKHAAKITVPRKLANGPDRKAGAAVNRVVNAINRVLDSTHQVHVAFLETHPKQEFRDSRAAVISRTLISAIEMMYHMQTILVPAATPEARAVESAVTEGYVLLKRALVEFQGNPADHGGGNPQHSDKVRKMFTALGFSNFMVSEDDKTSVPGKVKVRFKVKSHNGLDTNKIRQAVANIGGLLEFNAIKEDVLGGWISFKIGGVTEATSGKNLNAMKSSIENYPPFVKWDSLEPIGTDGQEYKFGVIVGFDEEHPVGWIPKLHNEFKKATTFTKFHRKQFRKIGNQYQYLITGKMSFNPEHGYNSMWDHRDAHKTV